MLIFVIVEFLIKVCIICNYLFFDYCVEVFMGYVCDLLFFVEEILEKFKGEKWVQLGVNVELDFELIYVVFKDKKKIVKEFKDVLKEVDELFLVIDEDCEGESISWYLL